jgi:hypothetical protein
LFAETAEEETSLDSYADPPLPERPIKAVQFRQDLIPLNNTSNMPKKELAVHVLSSMSTLASSVNAAIFDSIGVVPLGLMSW